MSSTNQQLVPIDVVNTMIRFANEEGLNGRSIRITWLPAKNGASQDTFLMQPKEDCSYIRHSYV